MEPSTLLSGSSVYNFIRGPLVWISLIVFLFGIVYQVIKFFSFTKINNHIIYNPRPRKKVESKRFTKENFSAFFTKIKLSIVGVNPVMLFVTTVFHLCLIIAPIFLLAHNILIRNSLGISLFSFSETVTDYMTIVLIACGCFFLLRRILVPRVRAITNWYDYFILFLAIAPFITGYLAYHQFLPNYRLIISLHIVFGELMLMAIPFTKFVHMVFFFVFRFVIESEYSLGKGDRTW
jgi:nitrate reductase gamma subunit